MMKTAFGPSLLLFVSLFLSVAASSPAQGEVHFLSERDSLEAWEGHERHWSIQNGVIIGKSTEEVPVSTFLVTRETFTDFRLTASAKLVSGDAHSGLAFWGKVSPEHGDPYTYAGPLVMFNGQWGFYDLFGRKDLQVDCSAAAKAAQTGEWTDLEILAVSNRVRLVVNGVLAAEWVETEPGRAQKGPIGLQLASNSAPQEIQFKQVVVDSAPQDRLLTLKSDEPNNLTVAEIAEGWISLFDGKSTQGWRGYRQEAFPSEGWEIVEGSIRKIADGGGGDIITLASFKDFDFSFEWKVAPGANSGVMYRVSEEEDRSYYTGPEYQVLDDDRHNDGKSPLTSAASIYALFPAENKRLKPVGEFNTGRIVLQGNRLEHWLNGDLVAAKEIGSEEWNAKIADSKFEKWKKFGTMPEGHIVLQDHGDDVWFRNLKIKPLK